MFILHKFILLNSNVFFFNLSYINCSYATKLTRAKLKEVNSYCEIKKYLYWENIETFVHILGY